MPRSASIGLTAAVGVLLLLNVFIFIQARGGLASRDAAPETAWDRWRRMTVEARAAAVNRYREIARREDALAVLRRARQFEELSAQRQDCLREVHHELQLALARPREWPAPELVRSSPQLQAWYAYQDLMTDDPERLRQLAECLRSAS
jgi:hypothetical protein